MGFQAVCRALYDYVPQADAELAINEGDLLYILDKNSDDGWWKAKKKANTDDGDEPVGLVPNNYVEEARPLVKARALYEYTRQTDEELSFPEDAGLSVYDASDEDWILVGLGNEFGFAPANYLEMQDSATEAASTSPPPPPSLPVRPTSATVDDDNSYGDQATPSSPPPSSLRDNPAAALAGVMQGRSAPPIASPPMLSPASPSYHATENEDGSSLQTPELPVRPRSQISPPPPIDSSSRQPHVSEMNTDNQAPQYLASGGFHMYNINEMVSVMGKRKKMPTVLGINLATGTILIAPERTQDGPTQEWTAEKMVHYSRETKHVFLELVKPSKSVDFHAGAKDTAEEIVSALGELAGAVRAQGLREEIFADTGKTQKRGQILYDFDAQGDDEVSVTVGDEVIIIDDAKSDEWWQVRRLKNGKEGVVPSSYIETTGVVSPPPRTLNSNAGLSTVEQNRLEEIRLTKEAMKAAQHDPQSQAQVGPGMPLPERGSSLLAREQGSNSGQRSKRENGRGDGSTQRKPKPDSAKVRTWTDRSKSFSVDAQFLGLKDGKINLHKMNGVKIAVPIAKMSLEDLEYVEAATGISLDEDKPLSTVKRNSKTPDSRGTSGAATTARIGAGASVEQQPRKPEYDWFQFFLSCDVAVGVCERYAQAFSKESMDESILPDVDASVLRNLGLREGDILKVMRYLDSRFGRTGSRGKRSKDSAGSDEDGGEGGLFSGPGGALRNNTRKGRPAPAVQTSDVVDAQAFSTQKEAKTPENQHTQPRDGTGNQTTGGFDDDAWDIRPGKAPEEVKKSLTEPAKPPALTGSMQELSLLTTPLEPSRPLSSQASGSSPATQPSAVSPQPTGATPSYFAAPSLPNSQLAQQQAAQRLRPTPPQPSPTQGSLVPPPPARPLSAPQSAQNSGFAPPALAPQMTGLNYQTRVAPPGQSLDEVNQARLQQQFLQQQQQQIQQMQHFPTSTYTGQQQPPFPAVGAQPGGQFMPPMMAGTMLPQATGLFGDMNRQSQFTPMQPQPIGYVGPYPQTQSFNPQPTGSVNNFLPPALEPQRTGLPPFQSQSTGFSSPGSGGAVQMQPLQPQQTGPAPPVRFGVTGEAKRLAPQPTGRRANLSQATPNNPFGF
ncbi:hypothetical protein ACHAQH_009054 [Verticillium albo-atrum]